MSSMFKKILSLSFLLSTGTALADCNTCTNGCDQPATPTTCFVPRSQSFHNELKNAVMDPDHQYLYDIDGFYGSFNIMFEYNQTFNSDTLAKCLFGPAAVCIGGNNNNGCDEDSIVLRVVGTNAASFTGASNPNGMTDLVADNFFLPKDYISTISVKPSIQNFNIHLQAYFGFDEWCNGMWLRVYAPISISRWKLETEEKVTNAGTDANGFYAAGEIAPVQIGTDNLFGSFLEYTRGGSIELLPSTTPTVLAAPTVAPLKFTRFGSCDRDTTTQLADLRAELGWNFVLDEDYHFGLYIAAAAPTGDDCEGDCDNLLWGAKAGNGKHWELGGGVTAHYTICRSEDCDSQLDFYVDATVNHMFKHTEKRTFDLKNKPLSRYIMAEQLTTEVTNGLAINGTAATYQFAEAYAPVANFTTRDVQVSYPVQADVMAKFVYTTGCFSWALGYDFWVQACPSVELDCDCTKFPEKTWALRGNAHVYGFGFTGGEFPALADIQPIPATFNNTTAFNIGTAFQGGTPANANGNVDSPLRPVTVTGPTAATLKVANNAPAGENIFASTTPVFIKESDLDICNVGRGMSNSIFTELNWTWSDRECWIPYLGIGARVEFGSNGDSPSVAATPALFANQSDDCCNGCDTCTASVWGVWIKGGISYN